eukprot:comp22531_c0_seq1/m.34205 comp22531_c0_seq1/g.34205  ORF comp22531_c0_seq1/g.34205 comp22531_c0_seq1/m.34205 type:complete len:895 (-) comp22531_c0_seq1:338-3022(-)
MSDNPGSNNGASSPPPYNHSTDDIPPSNDDRGEAEEAPYDDDGVEMQDVDDDGVMVEEEEEGEDLFGDDMGADYQPMPNLDRYDTQGIDDEEDFDDLDAAQRRAAEEEMERRDRRRVRRPEAFDEESDEEERGHRRRRQRTEAEGQEDIEMLIDEEERDVEVNLMDRKGQPLREFLCVDAVRKTIGAQFRKFLTQFLDPNTKKCVYGEAIKRMCSENKMSLVVSYQHLCAVEECAIIAVYLADAPIEMLKIFDEVAQQVVLKMFPDYQDICRDIHVRISNLPIQESLREIRQSHLNALVKCSGVVTRRTGILPQLKVVKYNCAKCGALLGPYMQEFGQKEIKIGSCPDCQSKGPFPVNVEETIYRNYQKIILQESPGTVPPGRLPRQKTVVLMYDLVDCCKPGDEIEVTGIYRNNFDVNLNRAQGFPVFSTVIVANYVSKAEVGDGGLTEDDIAKCRALGKDPRIGEKIVNSIAPSIYGHENIKTALALSMFGGEAKEAKDKKHRVRGDINVLLMGDPGTAKSQFLKYVEKTAPRCVYTTGQGASAVGLTASVHLDPVTREWTLEGGALVLADRGVCLIDEFDKMNDQDRTSIHEAMEQQSISISKAGIVTSLQARCAVIAAANPVSNTYDPTCTFSQNVKLTEPILSRFDILCVVQDRVDRDEDLRLASFVTRSHVLNHPANRKQLEDMAKDEKENEVNEDKVPQQLLRKYIKYSRMHCRPKLQNIDTDKLTAIYTELRREALVTNSIPITVRHLESMIRMAEAHARMHLRDYVHEEDVNVATRVMLESFISTQKASVMSQLRKSLSKFLTFKKDHNELLLFLLNKVLKSQVDFLQARRLSVEGDIEIDIEEFEVQARRLKIKDLSAFYRSDLFKNRGFRLDADKQVIVKTVS